MTADQFVAVLAAVYVPVILCTWWLLGWNVQREDKRRAETTLFPYSRKTRIPQHVDTPAAHCVRLVAATVWPILFVAVCSCACIDRYKQWRIGRRLRDTWGDDGEDML